jgi:hypothetical protein
MKNVMPKLIITSLSLVLATASAVAVDLDNFDDLQGYFDPFNQNVTYTTADLDASGDNELQIDNPGGGFTMVLRRVLQGFEREADPFLALLEENPVLVYNYWNLSETDAVTLAITVQNDILDEWITIGGLAVSAGASGTYAFALGTNEAFSGLIDRWLAGEGTSCVVRITQQTGSGVASSVGYDDFSLQPASYFDVDSLVIDNFDDITGGVDPFNPNAVFTTLDADSSGDNELQVEFANGGFNMPIRIVFQGANRAEDPVLSRITGGLPVFAFNYWNLSPDVGTGIGLILENDILGEWLPLEVRAVGAGSNGMYALNLMEDADAADLINRWLAGEGTALRLRIVQDSDAASIMAYDDFSLEDASFIPDGGDLVVIENFDEVTGDFQAFNVNNATYATEDFDEDGDNELKISFANGGFNMGLRRRILRTDEFLEDLAANPGFYFEYTNVSDQPVTLGVAFANDFYGNWPALGTIEVEPGESGTYAFDLWNNGEFQELLTQWTGGAGTFLQLRILQDTPDEISSEVIFDDFALGEAPEPQLPINVVMGEWSQDPEIGWVWGLTMEWAYSLQMGSIYFADYPWIYQTIHGWFYFGFRASEVLVYLYSSEYGWILSTEDVSGWFYILDTDTWQQFVPE